MKNRSSMELFYLICIITASIPSTQASESSKVPAITVRSLDARDDTSCKAADSTLPDNFTCRSGTNCISLDNSSSAVCCPDGGNCKNIETISCDVSKQDATTNPNGPIFTTKTQDKLPTCGDQCCPFGYTCNQSSDGSNAICQLNVETSSLNGNKSPQTSTSPSTTSPNSTPSSTQSSNLSGIDSNAPQGRSQSNNFPAGVFLAGFFPGIIVGILIMLAWVICTGRNRKSNYRHSHSSSASFRKPVISDPIPLGAHGSRTEFLRRTTTRAKSIFSNKSSPRVDSNPWKMPTPPAVSNIPPQPLGIPITPERRLAHEPSTESIKVYSPPSVVQHPLPPPLPAVTTDRKLAPLRGMASQRPRQPSPSTKRTAESNIGSPFKTPPNVTGNTYYGESSVSPTNRNNGNDETLSPARYEAATDYDFSTGRQNNDSAGDQSRRTTTFTEMLHGIGFPDPMQNNTAPAVPKVPKGYRRGDRI